MKKLFIPLVLMTVALSFLFSLKAYCSDCFTPPAGLTANNGLDFDGDGIENAKDNCPFVKNTKQEDNNNDSVGNACDSDEDGLRNHCDNCLNVPNPEQIDKNNNGIGDVCEKTRKSGLFSRLFQKKQKNHKIKKISQSHKPSFSLTATRVKKDFSEFDDSFNPYNNLEL